MKRSYGSQIGTGIAGVFIAGSFAFGLHISRAVQEEQFKSEVVGSHASGERARSGTGMSPELRAQIKANKQILSDAAKAIDQNRLSEAETLLASLDQRPYVNDEAFAFVRLSLLERQGKKREAFTLAKTVFERRNRDGTMQIGGSSSGLLCYARLAREVGESPSEQAAREVLVERTRARYSLLQGIHLNADEIYALSYVAMVTQGGGPPDEYDVATCKYAVELAPNSLAVLYCFASTAKSVKFYEDSLDASRRGLELWRPGNSEELRRRLRSIRDSSMQLVSISKPKFGPGKNPIEGLEFHHFIFGRQPGSPFNPPPGG